MTKEMFENKGYVFYPGGEGPSGWPVYKKRTAKGIIFFFMPVYGDNIIRLLIRKLKGKWIETVYENFFNASVFKEEEITEAEHLFNVL